jgi:OOP family OmpA-OmpF porin
MKIIERQFTALILAAACSLFISAAIAQPQYTGFKDTDALLEQATELQAQILAPNSYAAADKAYTTARKYTESGRLDTATKYIVKANASLRIAIEASKIATVVFQDSLQARVQAIAANAAQFEPALWAIAESELSRATRKLEAGNARNASAEANRVAISYSVAELASIKTSIVGNARVLIAEAKVDPSKVSRNAPITLAQANSLVAQAEAKLDANRYETDEPKSLAGEAEYQAKHAMYLAGQAAMLSARQMTVEELILKWEQPLRELAGTLEVTTDMTAGYNAASEAALARAISLVAQKSENDVRISTLEVELGDTEMIAQDVQRMQQQLVSVERLFRSDQAMVLREGDDLILRLVGMGFPTGQAVIETQYFGLLADVQDAIRVYPDAYVVVAAHTDSQGDDDINHVLSQQRANSVRSYLISNTGLPATRISAEGYGESRPIASNMYVVGRDQNRRIDIILKGVRTTIKQPERYTSGSRP